MSSKRTRQRSRAKGAESGAQVEQLQRLSPTFQPVSHLYQPAAPEQADDRLIAAATAAKALAEEAQRSQVTRMRVA